MAIAEKEEFVIKFSSKSLPTNKMPLRKNLSNSNQAQQIIYKFLKIFAIQKMMSKSIPLLNQKGKEKEKKIEYIKT
jgi:hypothetical protein